MDCPMCGMNCGDTCYRPTVTAEEKAKKDYATLAEVTKKLLESMRTGVQLSFKELDEIERMLK